jgi:hypothetical protein
VSDRIPCRVPNCRHTVLRPTLVGEFLGLACQELAEESEDEVGWEWICREHWRALPARQRRAYGRAKRRHLAGEQWRGPAVERLWDRLKRDAIERAAGL